MRLVFLATALFLMGCGFHLKGDVNLSHLSAVKVEIIDKALEHEVKKILLKQGINLSSDASIVLRVNDVARERFKVAIGKVGSNREFELREMVDISVKNGERLLGATTLESRGTVQYQQGQYLGTVEEEAEISAQMSAENAQKILRYLQAVSHNVE